MQGLRNILRWIVFNNIFVAFCVVALNMSSEFLLDTYNCQINQFLFFSCIFTYNYQRMVRSKRKLQQQKQRLFGDKKVLLALMLFSLLCCVFLFFQFNYHTQLLIAFLGIISVLYPFILREIPYCKIFIITLVWSASTVLLLVTENNLELSSAVYYLFLGRLLFILALTIPFDIRDLKYDNKSLKTIPIIFGASKARLIAILFLLGFIIIALLQYYQNQIYFESLIAIVLSCFFASILIIKSTTGKKDFYFTFWVESASIYLYFFLMLSTLLF
jgi:4-hydroxybenzoate polyprenyltransferase